MKRNLGHDKPATARLWETSSLNVDATRDAGKNFRTRIHPHCVACSPSNTDRGIKAGVSPVGGRQRVRLFQFRPAV
ncbi:MAG: hypothetical protein JRI22_23490 [Deltaproteobacteria bacterium]|nr:hypothetical protein [Deltaproteobacteria bacterium]